MLIPVLGVDDARHGGVKVGSNNLGGGNAFNPMSALRAAPAADVLAQNCTGGNDTVLVD
jgi:hypothetical protein